MSNLDEPESADTRLEQRSRELFSERVTNLDGRTRSRLNQARHSALEAARGTGRLSTRWWLPVGSAAAVTLVAMVSWQTLRPAGELNVEPNAQLASSVDDLEIITADADLELLQNMDFYAWLETQVDEPEAKPAEDG